MYSQAFLMIMINQPVKYTGIMKSDQSRYKVSVQQVF
jgi:hypothetical protein